ncbi:MAG: MarR family transcriptional regulator [Neptuniibacter sp.]|nr:MarR family transcriptional regulator [Neptuniibacter sp.]
MDKILKPLNMDASRWRVAMLLRVHGKLSISELTEHAIAKMPTITKTVYRMRDEGLVKLQQSEDDGRVMIVSLSAEGHNKVSLVREQTEELFERAFKGLTDAQIARATRFLNQFFDNISE